MVVRQIERDKLTHAKLSENVDYQDDAETERFRRELEVINEALAKADLGFVGEQSVDLTRRRLRRIFKAVAGNAGFDSNGRLAGGWWQNLDREWRHGIRIGCQPVADLDFSAMFVRLLYVRAGLEPPSGSLYNGILAKPDEEQWRDGVKQFVNAMVSSSKPLVRFPKNNKNLLPKGLKAAELREAVLRRHAPIRHMFERGLSVSLMRTESDLLVAILLQLIGDGIVALPMNDGLMVQQDYKERAETVMREVSAKLIRFELPVKNKALA